MATTFDTKQSVGSPRQIERPEDFHTCPQAEMTSLKRLFDTNDDPSDLESRSDPGSLSIDDSDFQESSYLRYVTAMFRYYLQILCSVYEIPQTTHFWKLLMMFLSFQHALLLLAQRGYLSTSSC